VNQLYRLLQTKLVFTAIEREMSFPSRINRYVRLVFWQRILHTAVRDPLARFVVHSKNVCSQLQKQPPLLLGASRKGDIQLVYPFYYSHPERGFLGLLNAKQRHPRNKPDSD
jgi:hypothetical protein